jgi:hypothetical protein
MAKAKILTNANMRRAKRILQQLFREHAIARSRKRCIETNLEHFLNAQLRQSARALRIALQTKGRCVRLKEAARVRFEHGGAQSNAAFFSKCTPSKLPSAIAAPRASSGTEEEGAFIPSQNLAF